MTDQISSTAIIEALQRIEEGQKTHTIRIDGHDERLSAHDRLIATLSEQSQQHGAMLLEHAKLHTDHAKAILVARETAREARQSSTDLSKEWRDAASAMGRHLDTSHEKLAEGQAAMREEFVNSQNKQLEILQQIVAKVVNIRLPRWVRITLAVAFTLGTFAAGILAGLVSHGVIKF